MNNGPNPKDIVGRGKVPMGVVPATFIAEAALGFLEGKLKYGQVNWRATPVYASVYIDALKRHIAKFEEGQDRDPETLVHHLGNAAACMGIIIDANIHGTLIDDRNFSGEQTAKHIDKLVGNVAHLKNLFKDKNPKHWQLSDYLKQEAENEEALKREEKIVPVKTKRVR